MTDNRSSTRVYLATCRNDFWQSVFQLELEFLAEHLEGCHDVLSIGCGPAIIEAELAKLGFQVTGLDVSREALGCAPDIIRTLVAKAEDMPLPDHSFDAVIYVASLQFIENYAKALERSVAVLRPDGKLLVLLLNPASEFFRSKVQDPDSYVSQIKHTDLGAIEKTISERFETHGEYFLRIEGNEVSAGSNQATMALYIISGTPLTHPKGV